MKTLQRFKRNLKEIPATVGWYLSDLGEFKGKQELFTRQSPQKLKVLREHAMIESAVSSNRIEGIEVGNKRIGTVIFGKKILHDRDEEELRGYRLALDFVHSEGKQQRVAEKIVRSLHKLSRGDIWDAGQYKEKDGDIIEKYQDGRERVRFKTVPAKKTPNAMSEMFDLWDSLAREDKIHPLIRIAALNLDFLCIHPFRDGNGRVSRLLLLMCLYQAGYEVGRYISIERLIEENKDRYYETLEQSSLGWHEGQHDPWPYIQFVFFIFKEAYKEFAERAGRTKEPKGAKTELIQTVVLSQKQKFTLADIEKTCLTASRDMIRKVLRDMKKRKVIDCMGKGPGALWINKGKTLQRG
ncbi:MAG: Fic family protein [Deltaproteobacteria bacterium]|nr:Fic family protein [Deltaproteobacteria bacterium]